MDSLILGLDPGNTIGYAALDFDGNIVAIDSFRGNLSEAISRVNKHGKVIVVGTDVKKVPRFVEKFSSKTGAQLISPKYNLLLQEKKKKTKEFLKDFDMKLKNRHEVAALAAAIIAFKSVNGLFNKIDNEYDKDISNKIKQIVLCENIPIKKAFRKVKD